MITKIFAVLLTVISTTAFATEKDSAHNQLRIVSKQGGDSYKLIYEPKISEPVFVSIKNQAGNIIASRRLTKNDGFILPVNMKNVESGKYNVSVRGRSEIVEGTLNHTTKSDYLKSRIFLQNRGGLFGLVGYDLGVSELDIKIFDNNGNLVHKDAITTNGVLNKTYKFKDIDSSWVEIVVYHKNDVLGKTRIKID